MGIGNWELGIDRLLTRLARGGDRTTNHLSQAGDARTLNYQLPTINDRL
ncbi:MAG: hypothetical protein HC786_01445 [Richelia sp. CSU_2_1]|nr:hypothetical protein [Microcoleus sp. SM1_3_4]NJR20934.1 hypothetical protein [Richelia sp. CSU_2_1]